MLSTTSLRKVVILLLVILAMPMAANAGPVRENPQPSRAFVAAEFFGRLGNLLKSVWGETGCMIDPNGKCVPGTNQGPQPGSDTDTGVSIDPNG